MAELDKSLARLRELPESVVPHFGTALPKLDANSRMLLFVLMLVRAYHPRKDLLQLAQASAGARCVCLYDGVSAKRGAKACPSPLRILAALPRCWLSCITSSHTGHAPKDPDESRAPLNGPITCHTTVCNSGHPYMHAGVPRCSWQTSTMGGSPYVIAA